MGAPKEGERVVATGRGLNMDAEAVRRRHGVRGELLLAVPPTVIVLVAVLTIELLRHKRVCLPRWPPAPSSSTATPATARTPSASW